MNIVVPKYGEENHDNNIDVRSYCLTDDFVPATNNYDAMKYASSALVESVKRKALDKKDKQERNFREWNRKDVKFRWDLICKFAAGNIVPSDFQCTQLKEKDNIVDLSDAKWEVLKKKSIEKYNGLKLAGKLYSLTRCINLRSQALKLDLEFVLIGECQFNLITRSNMLANEESVIIRFTKFESYDNQRLFLMFGIIDPQTREIVMIKKTEIPIYKQKDEEMHISLSLIDNGNDIIALSGTINKNMRNTFRTICDRVMIPNFEDSNLIFYGNGDSVLLKTFGLDIIERLSDDSFLKKSKDSDCHACCKVF